MADIGAAEIGMRATSHQLARDLLLGLAEIWIVVEWRCSARAYPAMRLTRLLLAMCSRARPIRYMYSDTSSSISNEQRDRARTGAIRWLKIVILNAVPECWPRSRVPTRWGAVGKIGKRSADRRLAAFAVEVGRHGTVRNIGKTACVEGRESMPESLYPR